MIRSVDVAVLSPADARRRGRAYIVLAAIAWSTAGVLQRELSVGTATQLSGRAVFCVLALFVAVAIAERGMGGAVQAFARIGRAGLAVALLMAVSAACFIVALNHTTVANVLFMQALAPLLAAVLGRVVLGEQVTRSTWIAMAVALGGVALMVGGPGRPGALGGVLSFVMSLSFAGTLVVTRHRRDVSMAPATCLSQVLVLLGAAPFSHPGQIGGRDVVLLVALGVGQMGLGLLFLTIGARLIPAAEVALLSLLEVVLAPLWVWLALSEQPGAATLAGGLVVLVAVGIQVVAEASRDSYAPPP